MVVTYYIKLFHTGADRRNGILMSLLLLVHKDFLNINSLDHDLITFKFEVITKLTRISKNAAFTYHTNTNCFLGRDFKGTLMQFKNLPICSCSYKNNTMKILHS